MYIPHKYRNENLSDVREFIQHNSFGILVNTVDGRPWGTHIPLELHKDKEGCDVLLGHISRANPQWKAFTKDREVLCIFNGPHSYISSSWYEEEEVPTWNYIAVHVYGRLKLLSEEAVLDSLHKLVDKYESTVAYPISLHEFSPKTMRQIKGIVGFQVEIKEIHAAYKLSQGREEDHPKITSELKTRGEAATAIAEAMKKHKKR